MLQTLGFDADEVTSREAQQVFQSLVVNRICNVAVRSCADLDVEAYHAGKDGASRSRIQADWTLGGIDTLVSTVAFGMCVMKPRAIGVQAHPLRC